MEDNEIISHIKEFPAGNIYHIAPKQYLVRGFQYYQTGRVVYFDWEEDRKVLIAGVKGENIYEVYFFRTGSRLDYECTCPVWSRESHCKHVVCALVTVKNILDPRIFDIGRQSEEYRRMFSGNLIPVETHTPLKNAVPENESFYSIVLGQTSYSVLPAISIERDKRTISAANYPGLPAELREMIEAQRYYYADRDKVLSDYLNRHGNSNPIILDTGKGRIPVEWDGTLVFSAKTRLDITDGMVTLSRVCFNAGGECPDPYLFGEKFLIDLKNRKMGVIKDKSAWIMWHSLADSIVQTTYDVPNDERFKGEYSYARTGDSGYIEPLHISLKRFLQFQMVFYGEKALVLQDLILSINGKESSPVKEEHTYSMIIKDCHGIDGKLVLKACSTTKPLFDFLPDVINGRLSSPPLRAKKRVSVLVKTFLSLLTVKSKNKAEAVIKEALSEGDFYKRSIRNEGKRVLMHAFSRSNTPSFRVRFYNDCWYLVINDYDMEALLYTVPFEIFGTKLFEEMTSHDEMVLAADRLYKHLPDLYTRLRGHNISLLFKGKKIKSTKWDFSFDCRRDSGIDWFEIRPEIKCDNILIDDGLFQRALASDGVVEGEDFVEILDQDSQEILKSIASLYREGKDSKGRTKQIREIVHVPRLRILDWIYLRSNGVKVRLPKEDEELIERLNRFEKIEKRDLPEGLRAKLRHYQKDGYYWLSFLYEHRFGACLADDMGLGKTLQAIILLAGIKEGKVVPFSKVAGPHLIVLPPSLLFNWEREIERFYPDLKIHLYAGKERSTEFGDADVVLTTYGLVRRDIDKLKEIPFHVIIFDEAQAIKNIIADTTGSVRQLNGYFKLTMTGTPIENHLGEYFSILDLSLPGLLGDYDVFKSHIKLETSPALEVILRRTRPFVLRRTKDAILKELPPKTESDIYLELSEKQKALYKRTVDMVRSKIEDAYENNTRAQAQIIALTAILKLRQLCVSPGLIDPAFNEPSPKIEFLIGKLNELMEEGHSALVFSQFTSFLDILERDLKENELSFSRLDGSTPVGKRKKLVEGFQEGEGPKIFLLSLKAGGQGLNLTKASYVFHLDPWWNPAVENQASDRAHRIGQTNKVTIIRILMRHTIEEKMMALKMKKLSLYKAVMEGAVQGKKGLSITKTDFDYLLNF